MRKNKYIMSSKKGTGEEEKVLETSIKEKKIPLEGCEGSGMVFFSPFSSQFYAALKFHLFPDVKRTTLIFHLLSHTVKLPENKHYSINLQGFLFLNTCDSPSY